DLEDWGRVIASVLASGGELYCADAHPGFVVLEEHAGRLAPTFDFETAPDRPLEFVDDEPATYIGRPAPMAHRATRVWLPSLRAFFAAPSGAGMPTTWFREQEGLRGGRPAAKASVRRGATIPLSGDVESLVAGPDPLWRLRDGHPRLPLSF